MIISVTSKRGGTGCTTLAVILSLSLSKKYKKKVCLVDLKENADISRLLRLDTNSCIDSLLTELGFNSKYIKVEDTVVNYNEVDILVGTSVSMPMYLYKRASKIRELLLYLEEQYDIVVVDIEDGLLQQELISKGVNLYPVNVLEQNMRVIYEYQENMESGIMNGLIVVNKLEDNLFPEKKLFYKNFPKSKLFFIPYSLKIKNIMNRIDIDKLNFSAICKTAYYTSIDSICQRLIQKYEESPTKVSSGDDELFVINSPSVQETVTKKKGFFSLFRKGRK